MAFSRLLFLSALCFLAGCTLTPPQGGFEGTPAGRQRVRQINARYGAAILEQATWGSLNAPTQVAVDFAELTPEQWLFLETGFNLGQSEDGGRLSNGDRAEEGLTVLEFSGGLLAQIGRKDAPWKPYAGLGFSALWAESDLIEDDVLVGVQDGSLGVYGKAGVLLRVGTDSYLGLETRYLEAGQIDTASGSRDLGGAQISLVFGATF